MCAVQMEASKEETRWARAGQEKQGRKEAAVVLCFALVTNRSRDERKKNNQKKPLELKLGRLVSGD